jgi:hypothetical protein
MLITTILILLIALLVIWLLGYIPMSATIRTVVNVAIVIVTLLVILRQIGVIKL